MAEKENKRKCFKCGASPTEDGVKLFRFTKPGTKNLLRCEMWAKYMFPEGNYSSIQFQRKLYDEHRVLCERHFKAKDFSDDSRKRLVRNAVPSDLSANKIREYRRSCSSHQRRIGRNKKRTENIEVTTQIHEQSVCGEKHQTNTPCVHEESSQEYSSEEDLNSNSKKPLSKSKLRRGPKTKHTSQRMSKDKNPLPLISDTIILGNLPPTSNNDIIENLVERLTGMNRYNSLYYVEVLTNKPRGVPKEAVIKFREPSKSLKAFEKLQVCRLLGYSVQFIDQTEVQLGRKFQNRYNKHIKILKAWQQKARLAQLTPGVELNDKEYNTAKDVENQIKTEAASSDSIEGTQVESINSDNKITKTQNENIPNITLGYLDVAIKTEQITLEDSEKSNDSTSTLILSKESANINNLIKDVPSSDNETVTIKTEPIDTIDIVKHEPGEGNIGETQCPEIDASINAISEVLDNFDPREIEIKQEPMETDDADQSKANLSEGIKENIEGLPSIVTSETSLTNTVKNDLNVPIANSTDISVKTEQSVGQKNHDTIKTENDIEISNENASDIAKSEERSKNTELPQLLLNLLDGISGKTAPTGEKDKISNSTMVTNETSVWETIDCTQDESETIHTDSPQNLKNINSSEIEKDPNSKTASSKKNTIQENTRSNDKHKSADGSINQLPGRLNDKTQNFNFNESNINNCKIIHIKNLPTDDFDRVSKILDDLLKGRLKTGKSVTYVYQFRLLQDEIEHSLLGEALMKFDTHKNALRACQVLDGVRVDKNIMEVKLDIGHKILDKHLKAWFRQTRKRKRQDADLSEDDEPPSAKQFKLETLLEEFFKKKRPMPKWTSNDDYGFSLIFLKKLGLQLPLSNTIIVKKLHELVDEAKLQEVFSIAGDIKLIQFNEQERKARIEYDHPVEAVQAIHMFRKQCLYNQRFEIYMENRSLPKPLPVGLSGINKGFGRNGEPLRGARTFAELKNIHECLYELGKMNKFESNNISGPFNIWYGKRTNSNASASQTNTPDSSGTSSNVDSASDDLRASSTSSNKDYPSNNVPIADNLPSNTNKSDQNSIETSDIDSETIKALGKLLVARRLIPDGTSCKDVKSILAALNIKTVNQAKNDSINQISTSNQTTNIPSLSSNVYTPPSVTTPSMIPNSTKSPLSYTHSLPNPVVQPNIPVGQPLVQPTVSWEQILLASRNVSDVHSSPTQSWNRRHTTDKRKEDYPRDPRVNRFSDKGMGSGDQICNRLIFRNLPPSVTQAALTTKMQEVGDLNYCEVMSKGTAIVSFKNFQDAARCLQDYFIGQEWMDKLLKWLAYRDVTMVTAPGILEEMQLFVRLFYYLVLKLCRCVQLIIEHRKTSARLTVHRPLDHS